MEMHVAEAGTGAAAAWTDRWFDAWFATLVTGAAEGLADPVRYQAGEERARLRHSSGSERRLVVAAVDGGGAVPGAASLELPLRDNTDVVLLELVVHPASRRRGLGTALLAAVRDLAGGQGRSSVLVEIRRPLGSDRTTWPGTAFAAARGLTPRLTSVRRDLALPVDARRADELLRAARASARGYRVHGWAGAASPGDRERLAPLLARMSTDAPLGELDYSPEVWDAGRVAEQDAELAAVGRSSWTAVAVVPDGAWAGFTQLTWSRHEPQRLHQWDTLVLREHRGRRLGLLLKLEALRLATADVPGATVCSTWNAEQNTPMVAVNEAMGYRPVELLEEWQARFDELVVPPVTASSGARG